MRKFKKVMAALLAGTLIVGSVNVMPAEAGVTKDEIDILLQQDFDTTDVVNNGFTPGGAKSCVWKTDAETGDGYLFLNTSTSTSNFVGTMFANDYNGNAVIWIDMDIYVESNSNARPYSFTVDAFGQGYSTTYQHSVANYKQLWISNDNIASDHGYGQLSREADHKLSYKIDLVNGKFTAFVDGKETYSGDYTEKVCKYVRVTLGYHSTQNKEAEGIRIDNMAVYAYNGDKPVDIFAEPTRITLDREKLSSMSVGDTVDLTATVETNGIIPEIEWESDNEDVATVENGKVTAVGRGQATITARAGDVQATCVVMVGVADILMKQDFEDVVEGGLGFATANGTALSIQTEGETDNCYMQYLQENTSGSAGTLTYSTSEAITEGKIWVEMSILTPNFVPGNAINILATKTTWDTRTILASIDGERDVYGKVPISGTVGREKFGEIYTSVWTKLSFEINLDERTYMAYTTAYDSENNVFIENKLTTSGTFNDDGFQNIIIQVPASSTSPSRPIYIDNMAVYTCGEKVNVFAPEIKGANLSLDGNIGVNFHTDLGGYVGKEHAYMKLTLPNGDAKQIKFTDEKIEKDPETGYYKFSCEVAAKEMTEDIKVQIYEGNREMIEPVFYSVYQNATYIIENATSDLGYANAEPLARALLNYGAYAQERFEHNTENLANKAYKDVIIKDETIGTVTTGEITDLATYAYTPTTSTPEIGVVAGASLSLNSETALNFYFTLATDVQNLTFTCGEEELKPVKSGSMYYVKVDNISAANLDTPYTVDVTDNEGNTLSASYSALAYVYNVLNLENNSTGYGDVATLKNVVHALYKYNKAANAYFEQ